MNDTGSYCQQLGESRSRNGGRWAPGAEMEEGQQPNSPTTISAFPLTSIHNFRNQLSAEVGSQQALPWGSCRLYRKTLQSHVRPGRDSAAALSSSALTENVCQPPLSVETQEGVLTERHSARAGRARSRMGHSERFRTPVTTKTVAFCPVILP